MAGAPPLAGVRVVDLTHDWAGPHATRLLADFGAEVIRVEHVRRLDLMRLARTDDRAYDRHPRWLQLNRNKRSLTLDLGTPDGAAIFRDLVRVSDVVVESSRPGVLDRLGLGYPALSAIRPDIIVVSMSAFGQTGPEAGYAGYGGCLEAVSGAQGLTAYEAGGRPMRVREMDVINGLAGACAIMTALEHRRQTGVGQRVDCSQLETTTGGLIGEHLLEYVMNGTQQLPAGNRHPWFAPQGCYRCRGDDAWVVVTIRSDEEWVRLCEVIDRKDLIPVGATREERRRRHAELDRAIEAWTEGRSPREAMAALQERGIAAGAVLDVAEIAADPHLARRGYFQRAADGRRFPGLPFRLSDGVGAIARPGPALGEANEDVICGLLGRPRGDVVPVNEDEIGTAFDPE